MHTHPELTTMVTAVQPGLSSPEENPSPKVRTGKNPCKLGDQVRRGVAVQVAGRLLQNELDGRAGDVAEGLLFSSPKGVKTYCPSLLAAATPTSTKPAYNIDNHALFASCCTAIHPTEFTRRPFAVTLPVRSRYSLSSICVGPVPSRRGPI
jgi:hypothetical protein